MTPASPDRSDRLDALLRDANAGDEAAYGRFLREAALILRAFARRRAPARASGFDPEDLVQEILMAVHAKRHTWIPSEPVGPWLFAIARHKAVDAYRRHGRRVEVDIADFADLIAAPQSEAAAEERSRIAAVKSLEGRQRDVVSALSVEGRSVRETADRLGISEGAVRVAFHRGLQAIAAKFGGGR